MESRAELSTLFYEGSPIGTWKFYFPNINWFLFLLSYEIVPENFTILRSQTLNFRNMIITVLCVQHKTSPAFIYK